MYQALVQIVFPTSIQVELNLVDVDGQLTPINVDETFYYNHVRGK